jgi:peptidoglycan/xylan/chitin deacetylase (PgdA/CDA1 family)
VTGRAPAAAGLLAAAAYWSPSLALVSESARRALGVRARVAASSAVALTFDDGPHPRGTPAVLELFARESIQATFFLVGEQVRRRPALAAEIAAAGHEVAVHCNRHRNLMRLGPGQTRRDLEEALDAIGGEPRRYRPPYGILTTPALVFARRQSWQTVLWRSDGHDWEAGATPHSIGDRCLATIEAGDVVLLHDSDAYSAPESWRRTTAALPYLLEGLRKRGLGVAPLSAGTEA